MKKAELFEVPPPPIADTGLTCKFGEPWMELHPLCEAHADDMCQQFAKAVRAGTYDAAGYTPNERRAQAKRRRTT